MGCENNQPVAPSNSAVVEFIEQLKQGTYESKELPEFNYRNIPELLEHANETQLITDFPVNWISSYLQKECSLGMFVLWTVESVRTVSIQGGNMIGRFPSQNPIVQKKGEPFRGANGSETQEIILNAYLDWWSANKGREFDEFKQTNPLEDTEYRWH